MTVYVTQETELNISPATRFGDKFVYLTKRTDNRSLGQLFGRIKATLTEFTDDDYILCVGNPSAIGAAVGTAARLNDGRCALLVWDNFTRDYEVVDLDMTGAAGNVCG